MGSLHIQQRESKLRRYLYERLPFEGCSRFSHRCPLKQKMGPDGAGNTFMEHSIGCNESLIKKPHGPVLCPSRLKRHPLSTRPPAENDRLQYRGGCGMNHLNKDDDSFFKHPS